MRIALLSDIHSNKYALEAVLSHARTVQVDDYWFLGDLFGYGPHGLAVLRMMRKLFSEESWMLGNQDAIYAGYLPSKLAREEAIEVLLLNEREIKQDEDASKWVDLAFERLHTQGIHCRKVQTDDMNFILTHGSLKDPYDLYVYPWTSETELVDFMIDPAQALCTEEGFPRVILFGHSHIPTLIHYSGNSVEDILIREYDKPYPLSQEWTLINPGSVGQPRDYDDRAGYAVIDTDARTVVYYRLVYDVFQAAADMQYALIHERLRKQLLGALGGRAPEHYVEFFRERSLLAGGAE